MTLQNKHGGKDVRLVSTVIQLKTVMPSLQAFEVCKVLIFFELWAGDLITVTGKKLYFSSID